MSDNTPDAGDTAEKRVRKPRVSKADSAPAASKTESAKADTPRSEPARSEPKAAPTEARPAPPAAESGAPTSAPAQATARTDAPKAASDPAASSGSSTGDGNAARTDGQPRGDNPQRADQNPPRGDQQRGGGGGGGGDQDGRGNRRERFRNRRERGGSGGGGGGGNRGNRDGFPSDDGGNETFVPRPNPQVPEGFPQYSLGDLKRMPAHKLLEIADQLNIQEGVARARKQDVIFAVLKVLTRHGEGVAADGVLEILPDGFGFLRAAEASYLAGPDDTYISPSQIRRFNLRTGDHLSGRIRFPKDGERYFALSIVDTINGEPLEASKNKVLFENLTPLFPRRKFTLERGDGSTEDITGRILDLMAPQGKGQRALIVSPPKAGKTMLMQQVATAITHNHPDVHLIVLLVDERPEEVTEMQRTVRGEVVSSTFDEPAGRHVQVAEMVIERAKRLVEHK
ncbi:MAG TPA: transcription termination factor Rho, partial [Xanthomonadaceae bacterium]|nr:transcription termination factor Rho [Xanthomonadaceae bacterium]